jgi:hypothetical protein
VSRLVLIALSSLVWSSVTFPDDRPWASVEASVGTMTLTWKAAGCQRIGWVISGTEEGQWTVRTWCRRWGR